MSLVYHICPRAAWVAAQAAGLYRPASMDSDGFVHASTAAQVAYVANTFYKQVPDLVLLCIDPDRLEAPLHYEPPVHPAGKHAPDLESRTEGDAAPEDHERFPHVYGPLNLNAVVDVLDLPPNPDGSFTIMLPTTR